ncbi:hypothetical protein [Geomesophilobacter sediminis]|uniref:Uncharacterized protein n=1 Tax=Geomesophilobacter sediminis TaxID=2798584 RepID=A0A8J7JFS5_9BACT|nr:hypothetical protein [Geomesophilobacter sediminis]MBJ6725259.1 hypothetical protein [Geomesophilobacter sediminis]
MFDERDEQRNEGLTTATLAGAGEGKVSEPGAAAVQIDEQERVAPLFAGDEAQHLHARWDAIQGAFVDHPREAVEEADKLVAATMKRLAEMFSEERAGLEGQWDRGDDVSTEDLRQALRRYRSFFNRLLKI